MARQPRPLPVRLRPSQIQQVQPPQPVEIPLASTAVGDRVSVPHIPSPVRGAVGAYRACLGRFSGSLQHAGGQGPCDSRPATQQAGPGLYAIAVPVLVGVVSSAVHLGRGRLVPVQTRGRCHIPSLLCGRGRLCDHPGAYLGVGSRVHGVVQHCVPDRGAASFAFGFSPAIGIALVVAGVALEYESRRRRDRESREQLGRVLRINRAEGQAIAFRSTSCIQLLAR